MKIHTDIPESGVLKQAAQVKNTNGGRCLNERHYIGNHSDGKTGESQLADFSADRWGKRISLCHWPQHLSEHAKYIAHNGNINNGTDN